MNIREVAQHCARSYAVGMEREGEDFSYESAVAFLDEHLDLGGPFHNAVDTYNPNAEWDALPDDSYDPHDVPDDPGLAITGSGLYVVGNDLYVVGYDGMYLPHWRFVRKTRLSPISSLRSHQLRALRGAEGGCGAPY